MQKVNNKPRLLSRQEVWALQVLRPVQIRSRRSSEHVQLLESCPKMEGDYIKVLTKDHHSLLNRTVITR